MTWQFQYNAFWKCISRHLQETKSLKDELSLNRKQKCSLINDIGDQHGQFAKVRGGKKKFLVGDKIIPYIS